MLCLCVVDGIGGVYGASVFCCKSNVLQSE